MLVMLYFKDEKSSSPKCATSKFFHQKKLMWRKKDLLTHWNMADNKKKFLPSFGIFSTFQTSKEAIKNRNWNSKFFDFPQNFLYKATFLKEILLRKTTLFENFYGKFERNEKLARNFANRDVGWVQTWILNEWFYFHIWNIYKKPTKGKVITNVGCSNLLYEVWYEKQLTKSGFTSH